MSNFAAEDTPRNLLGFKDGTHEPHRDAAEGYAGGKTTSTIRPALMMSSGSTREGPAWLRGGSYVVVTAHPRGSLEHWDRTEVSIFRKQVIGRQKYCPAPRSATPPTSSTPIDLAAQDSRRQSGDRRECPYPPRHRRQQRRRRNPAPRLLPTMTASPSPPNAGRPGVRASLYDAGLFFVCYQSDPRTGFSKLFEPMSKLDALNQFTTHVGSGLFACPPGVTDGDYIGQALFTASNG